MRVDRRSGLGMAVTALLLAGCGGGGGGHYSLPGSGPLAARFTPALCDGVPVAADHPVRAVLGREVMLTVEKTPDYYWAGTTSNGTDGDGIPFWEDTWYFHAGQLGEGNALDLGFDDGYLAAMVGPRFTDGDLNLSLTRHQDEPIMAIQASLDAADWSSLSFDCQSSRIEHHADGFPLPPNGQWDACTIFVWFDVWSDPVCLQGTGPVEIRGLPDWWYAKPG